MEKTDKTNNQVDFDKYDVLKMQLPKGHIKKLQELVKHWNCCGISNVPVIVAGNPSKDVDNIVIHYTDVCNLVELIRIYSYEAGVNAALKID